MTDEPLSLVGISLESIESQREAYTQETSEAGTFEAPASGRYYLQHVSGRPRFASQQMSIESDTQDIFVQVVGTVRLTLRGTTPVDGRLAAWLIPAKHYADASKANSLSGLSRAAAADRIALEAGDVNRHDGIRQAELAASDPMALWEVEPGTTWRVVVAGSERHRFLMAPPHESASPDIRPEEDGSKSLHIDHFVGLQPPVSAPVTVTRDSEPVVVEAHLQTTIKCHLWPQSYIAAQDLVVCVSEFSPPELSIIGVWRPVMKWELTDVPSELECSLVRGRQYRCTTIARFDGTWRCSQVGFVPSDASPDVMLDEGEQDRDVMIRPSPSIDDVPPNAAWFLNIRKVSAENGMRFKVINDTNPWPLEFPIHLIGLPAFEEPGEFQLMWRTEASGGSIQTRSLVAMLTPEARHSVLDIGN